MSSGLSDKKSTPSITEPLGGAAAIGAQVQPKVKPIHIWATVGGAILAFQLYVWIRWISGPEFRAGTAGADRSADIHEGHPGHLDGRDRRRHADRHLLLPHQAVAAGAANHPRRHALRVLRPAVLPGSAPELLQHVEHIQHLDVEPGFVGAGRSGLGVVRETGGHDGRTIFDECAGLLLHSPVHDARLLGHAQSQAVPAQHQHHRVDRRGDRVDVLL